MEEQEKYTGTPFECDYFEVAVGTYRHEIHDLAQAFANDPYKAPEQIAAAKDYIKRFAIAKGRKN